MAAQAEAIAWSASVGDFVYRSPRHFGQPAPANERQGQVAVKGTLPFGDAEFDYEFSTFFSSRRSGYSDGRAELQGSAGAWRWKLGLLRETWGRNEGSRLNLLTVPNLVQGLLAAPPRIAQASASARIGLGDNSHLDLTALGPLRKGPLPAVNDRNGFGVPVRYVQPAGKQDQGALAARIFGSSPALDWGIHGFHGVSRDPSFVSSQSGEELVQFDRVTQLGYEVEVSPGDWRLWTEGFWRAGGHDRTGRARHFSHLMAGAEYQLFAAFGGVHDIVLGAQLHSDSRGAAADAPMQNALVLGAQLMPSDLSQWRVEFSTALERKSTGRLDRLRLARQISEAPFAELLISASHAKAGKRVSLLDVFAADASISAVLNWKF